MGIAGTTMVWAGLVKMYLMSDLHPTPDHRPWNALRYVLAATQVFCTCPHESPLALTSYVILIDATSEPSSMLLALCGLCCMLQLGMPYTAARHLPRQTIRLTPLALTRLTGSA